MLALFCVHRLRGTSSPDDWFADGHVLAGFAVLALPCGAVGQLVAGRPWFVEWSLGPPSILLAVAIAGVFVRDWRLRRAERQALLDAPFPWSVPPAGDRPVT
jgi:hypothetical protein